MRRIVVLALALGVAWHAAADGRRSRPVRRPSGWVAPQCQLVRGMPSVSFTTDGGRSLPVHDERLEGLQVYTFGLAALRAPGRLLAVTSRLLVTSSDGGCEWAIDARMTFPHHDYRLVPRSDRGVWAWSPLGPGIFVLDDDGTLLRQASAPALLPLGFSVDPRTPELLATGDDRGTIWWSDDGGSSWSVKGTVPSATPLYALEFSPHGRSHVIAAGLADGARVSFDGGATWNASEGLVGRNVFRVAFSPVDPSVVWALALDRAASGPSRRAIFHSSDGGASFRPVVAESATLDMPNGFAMAPSPVDARQLWFVLPGTSLHLVDDAGAIVSSVPLPYRDVNAIAFVPEVPGLMYLGLKLSDMSAR